MYFPFASPMLGRRKELWNQDYFTVKGNSLRVRVWHVPLNALKRRDCLSSHHSYALPSKEMRQVV